MRGGGHVSNELLFQVARARGALDEGASAVEAFVTQEHESADLAIRDLLDKTGLEPVYVDGNLSSMAFPFDSPD
ncbi:MAG: hypothetical protein ACI9MC_002973 [Kiritimatiellia bacterium]